MMSKTAVGEILVCSDFLVYKLSTETASFTYIFVLRTSPH